MALNRVWVFAEITGGRPAPVGLELLTRARGLAATVEAVALGPEAEAVAPELGRHGASTVYAATDRAYSELLFGGPAADTLAALVREHRPDLLLIGATYNGRDLAGRLAVKLDVPVVANGLDVEADGAVGVRSEIFGSTLAVTTRFEGNGPPIVLVRAKSFAAEPGADATPAVVPVAAPIDERHRGARIVDRQEQAATGPKLEEAAVVVSGGRGLGDARNFELLERVAGLLHGAVGASRAVVDAGWVPYSMQVGQTGKTVKPTVYIACGISGAMQHTVGMKGAKNIIAINRDREAPILKLADLGVVGDALQVLRQVAEKLETRAR